uniref:Retrotransposon protein, putative, unclassified n=2 Tax=Oryza sativa subsp. japonica TaxID=39947 RepID=Q53J28_ORYSJ|nr:Reverse transcriptase (RNA-dependent DNA polymerase), putative [Oryza sativa Japonica Group]ABA92966.2 retrotransposon protein, putative, unclassified [Oryza sativa Japonica Group]
MPSGTELQQRSLTEVPPKTNSPKPSGFEVHEGNIVPVTTDKLTPEQKKELDLMMQQTQHQFLNSFMETRKGTVVQKYKVLLRIDGELQQVPAATAESGSKGILEGSGDKGDSFQGVQVEDLGPDGNVVQPQFNNFQDRIDYAVQHTLINQSGVLVNTLSNMYFSPHLYFSPGSASTTKWSRREQPQHAGQNVNDDSGTGCYDDDDDSEVAAAEWVRSKKVVPCPWVKSSGKKERFDFDITKADKIFDLLLREKQIQLPAGHIIPSAEELGKRRYCKWHNSGSHSTNDCKVFRQQIQVAIEGGKIKFDDSKKPMKVDGNMTSSNKGGIMKKMMEVLILIRTVSFSDFAGKKGKSVVTALVNMVFMLPAEFRAKQADVDEVEEASARLVLSPEQAVFEKLEGTENRHLKPLYINGYVNGKPMSKMMVDGGAAVNLMPYAIFRKLGRNTEDLIKTNMVLKDFGGNSSETKGVLNVELTVGDKIEIVPADRSDNVASADLALWEMDSIDCLSGKVWDGDFLKVFDYDIQPIEDGEPNYYFEGVVEGSNIYTNNTVDDLDDKQGQGFMSADDLEEVDIGPSDRPRPTFISKNLSPEFRTKLIELLKEYRDCFPWEYYEMPGLSRSIVEHRLPIKPGVRPYQQPPRRCKADMIEPVKAEVKHLYDAGFIRPCRYAEWVSNIVPIIKKNGKVRVCIDFRDLNKATPKDEYPMPVADQLVDAASGHKILSFVDGNAGSNQIFMTEEDIHKTAFRCLGAISLFEWVVMTFSLKSAGATYQRAMNYIYHDLIGWLVEVYIDDVVVKSKEIEDHIANLRKVFERTRKYGLKMNPTKCAFGVSASQFLGFLVHERGIEITQRSVNAIRKIQPPEDKTELQEMIGKINFVRRLYLLAGEKSIGLVLIQELEGKERVVFYLSRRLLDAETRLRHYLLSNECTVICKADVVKYMLSAPILKGRIGKWIFTLTEFDLRYESPKAIKGQAIADFIVDHRDDSIGSVEIVPWTLFFDGSVCTHGCGIGLVIISPRGTSFEFAYTIKPYATNNQAEYEAVLKGLQLLKEVEADVVGIMGDSLPNPTQLASRKLRYKALKYTLLDDELYYRKIDGVLLKCLSVDQAKVAIGEFGAIQRAPASAMNPIIKSRSFRGWGIDMIGMINPPSTKGHKFILVTTDYFTKWVEAIPLKKVDSVHAIRFVQEHIIYRFGIPQTITTDQGSIFVFDEFVQFADSMGIKLLNSSPYYAQANGQAEASNKSLIKFIKRKISDYPRQWHTRLVEALWSYQMACHGSIQVPPYKLVYGHEAVLPWEVQIGSRRIELQNELTADEYYNLMVDEREDLVQSRLRALAKVTKDKERITRHYNEKVVPKSFSEGDLVWKLILPTGTQDNKFCKWSPNWEGPFQIYKFVSKGAYMLQGLDGEVYGRALNGKYLKKYYPSVWINR